MVKGKMIRKNSGDERNETAAVLPAAITDIGCEREINEDRYAVFDSPFGRVWLVCDGMGGVVGGELAAQIAVDVMRRNIDGGDEETPDGLLVHAISEANRVVVLRRQNPAFGSMGTTVVAVHITDDEIFVTHAGDSRAYLLQDGKIEQITTDHTYVQELVERGQLSQEEAMSHPQAHVLTRCLGADPRLDLVVSKFYIWQSSDSHGSIFLCSDGLYSLISDMEILDYCQSFHPQEACAQLVELARARGGYDNITVSIIPVHGSIKREEATGSQRPKKRAVKKLRATQEEYEPGPLGRFASMFLAFTLVGSAVSALVTILRMSAVLS
jgi:PPM family protein phosphatase